MNRPGRNVGTSRHSLIDAGVLLKLAQRHINTHKGILTSLGDGIRVNRDLGFNPD
jgi:hypothetical protein